MTGLLYAVARTCVRQRYVVLAVWLLVAVVLVAVSHRVGDNTSDNQTQPGTDSQRTTDTLSRRSPIRPTDPARSCCTSRTGS